MMILGYSQKSSRLDSLKTELYNIKQGPDKRNCKHVDLLNLIGIEMYYQSNDSSSFYINEAINIAEKIDCKKELARAYNVVGRTAFRQSNYDKAILYYDKAIIQYKLLNNTKKISKSYFNKAQAYLLLNNVPNAMRNLNNTLEQAQKISDTLAIAEVYNSFGILYRKLDNKKLQNEYYQKALQVLKHSTHAKTEIYRQLVQFNLAIYYNDNGKHDKALEVFLNLYEKRLIRNRDFEVAKAARSLGVTYFYIKKYNQAKYYLNIAIERNSKIDNKSGIADCYRELGKILFKQNNIPRAITMTQKALKISDEIKELESVKFAYQDLAKYYEVSKKYKNAYQAHINYKSISDTIFNSEVDSKLKRIQFNYELKQQKQQFNIEKQAKDKEIALKEGNIKLLEKDNTIKNNWLLFGGVGLTMLFVLLYLNRQRLYVLKQQELQKKYAQNLILEQENERKRIASELHDGVGQQLLLIKNQSITSNLESLKNITNQTIDEVRAISMNLHPYQLEEFGLTKAIKMNLKKFEQTTDSFVSYEVDDIDNLFNETEEVNIYRIIQECISNIVKHSKAKASRIELQKNEKSLQIIVNDNGVGYNFSKAYNSRSLGLKTLKERSSFLNGEMLIDSKKGKGTRIEFTIPLTTK